MSENSKSSAAEQLLAELQRRNEARMDSARQLASAVAGRIEKEQELAEARKLEEAALRDAQKHGWSAADLSSITGTTRKRRARRSAPTSRTTGSGVVDTVQHDAVDIIEEQP